jgi:hypothetical protein
MTSLSVHSCDECFKPKPNAVPPNTPRIVSIVRRFDFMKDFHLDVGLEFVVTYELDIADGL